MSRKDHNIPAMKICQEPLEKAIDGLIGAFLWHESKQGEKFWANIYNKLCVIRERALK